MSNAALFGTGGGTVLSVLDYEFATTGAMNAVSRTVADVGKYAFIEATGAVYVLVSVTEDGDPSWQLVQNADLSVLPPIVITTSATAKFPLWHGRRIRVDNAATLTFTSALPVGFICHILRNTADAVTLAGSGIDINSTAGAAADVTITEQFGWASVSRDSKNYLFAVGGLTAA